MQKCIRVGRSCRWLTDWLSAFTTQHSFVRRLSAVFTWRAHTTDWQWLETCVLQQQQRACLSFSLSLSRPCRTLCTSLTDCLSALLLQHSFYFSLSHLNCPTCSCFCSSTAFFFFYILCTIADDWAEEMIFRVAYQPLLLWLGSSAKM